MLKPWILDEHMGMDQYLLTSIYQLFWGSLGVQGFDTLPYKGVSSKFLCAASLRRIEQENHRRHMDWSFWAAIQFFGDPILSLSPCAQNMEYIVCIKSLYV